MFDYLIIGAGFAGSVMAERIATQLNKKVLIIEKRKHIGGNCYDFRDENNILIHQYGPHLFHTSNKKVWDYLSQFTEWEIYHHRVKAFVDGRKVTLPFNLNTLYEVFPNTIAVKLEKKLLDNFEYNTKVPILELKKSIDQDLQFLAQYIYEKIFRNYTSKQWGKSPEEIDEAVTARVPVFIGRDDRYFNDIYQALPKEGYTKIFERMLDHPNIKLLLNTDYKEVANLVDEKFYLFGNEFKGKVIFTGMIDELFSYRFGQLKYRSLDLKFETLDVESFQEVATVNYPNNYDFTRITEFKKMHPIKSNKTVILKEYPQDFVIGKNIPYYPIFTNEEKSKYERYKEYAADLTNIILLGRLAEYRYYDMDDIIERALVTFERLSREDNE
ncbi:UDP-galactopyranose mutase [Thermicanus aegyptius]|uniref:UDP-galactopyranose mutase n=1 Tax=Thermicanus aegyptius TaxID=94009 RepID=UPI00041364C0|nr:UDP-galactopyranose mutase [Thermicanus aegyptius]